MRTFVGGATLLGLAMLAAWSRPPRDGARAPLDWAEALCLTLAGLVAAVGWIAVVLASLGRFSLRGAGVTCAVAAAGLALAGRRLGPVSLRAPGWHEALLALLLVGCGVAYLRPHEYVLGGVDAGTYTNVAAAVARTGSLVVHDPWVGLAAEHADRSLRLVPRHLLPRRIQFVGWYVDDADPTRVLPQFLPFHPALLALGIGVVGLPHALIVPPLCAMLAVAAFYFAVRRLFGAGTALLAAAILAATPSEIFFARYPTAEPLAQLLVATGFLAYQHLRDGESRSLAFGILGGAAFGAATLTRIDLPLVVGLVAIALVLERRRGDWQRGWSAFAAVLGLLLLHAAVHFRLFAWPYVWNVYEERVRAVLGLFTAEPRSVYAAAAVVVALGGAASTLWLRRRAARGAAPLLASRGVRLALAWLVVAASAYAYFLRPDLEPPGIAATWPSGNVFPLLDGQNWVRMGWYLTPLGLALATLGLAAILMRDSLARVGLFVAAGAGTTVQYVWRIMTTPYHIYAMRRYVPVAIPALAAFAAVAITAVGRSRRLDRPRIVAALLAAALLAGIAFQSRHVLARRDMAGAWPQLWALNERLQPRSVVLITEPPQLLLADTFGPPLRYIFDHPVVPVRSASPDALPLLEQVMSRAAAEGRPVQVIAVDPIFAVLRENFTLRPVAEVPVTISQLMNTYDGFPSTVQTAHYGVEVYDVLPAGERQAPADEVLVDVGTLDTAFLSGGFHYKERLPDQPSARWTWALARLDVPVAAPGPVDVEIRARLFAIRDLTPGDVEVALDGQTIGRFRPDVDWQVFRFSGVAAPGPGGSTLQLVSPTFGPAKLGVNADPRNLGVYVDWVRVRPR